MNSPIKASWLMETDVFSENLSKMVKEIRRQGMKVEIASYLDTQQSDKTYLDLFGPDECVIYYGSLNFAAQVKREAKWIPGVYYNKPAFNCSAYYPVLGKHKLLNARSYAMIPYGDLLRQKEWLLEHLGEDGCVFIRPDGGSKSFTGKLVTEEDFARDVNYFNFYGTQPHDICVVARPTNIDAEWRFVIVEGRVITGSQYKLDDKLNVECDYPPEALELADEAAAAYSPDPVWCVDVCRTRKGNYFLLEIGCFSCAGLYDCNLEIVVREVSAAAVREWEDINNG